MKREEHELEWILPSLDSLLRQRRVIAGTRSGGLGPE